jgi:hypothetical protein
MQIVAHVKRRRSESNFIRTKMPLNVSRIYLGVISNCGEISFVDYNLSKYDVVWSLMVRMTGRNVDVNNVSGHGGIINGSIHSMDRVQNGPSPMDQMPTCP